MKNTRKIVRITKYGIICIMVCLGLNKLFWHNFYSHSLYYVKHTPRDEGYYPELLLFTQRYGNMPIKGKLHYDKDLSDGSIKSDNGKFLSLNNGISLYFYNLKKESDSYLLNYDGKIEIFDSLKHEKDMSYSDRQEFERMLAEYLAPMEEATSKPIINLQWLFDKIYEGRFVDE